MGNCFCEFPFISMDSQTFSKGDQLLMERICSLGANSFLYELTPFGNGGKNQNDRVASPESVTLYLKVNLDCLFISWGWSVSHTQKTALYRLKYKGH